MKRVLFVISGMGAGGAERVMSLLVNQGAQDGLEVALAVVSTEGQTYSIDERVSRYFLNKDMPKGRVKSVWTRFSRLRGCIKEYKPDVVVSFLTPCNIYTCLAGIGLGIPVVVSERNDPIRDCPGKVKRWIRNMCYRLASGVIFQTEDARNCFPKSIRAKSEVISNPVKDDLPSADLENREKTAVAAGRLTSQKNYPVMLKAFRLFHDTHPEYALHIYGGGELEERLKSMTRELAIEDCVEFKGIAKDLHDHMVKSGMFVLSSDYEGISNSLLEALSMGLPCISTDCPCGGSRSLIENGVNGLLVPVGDVEKMAEAMAQIADDPAFAVNMGNKARETREAHATAVILRQYYDFIAKNAK